MALLTFSARFSPTNSLAVNATTFDVTAAIFDGTGQFSGLDVAVGDVVFLDGFGSVSALATVPRYRVTQLNMSSINTVNVRLVFDDVGPVMDPVEVLFSYGFISRASMGNRFAWHAAPTLHNIPDYIIQYSRNKELYGTIDGQLGAGGGGGISISFADTVLSSSQILNLHTTPIILLPAPGPGLFSVIDSIEVRMPFNTAPYTNGADLIIDYSPDGNGNLAIDGAVLTSTTDATRWGMPVDNPIPDTVGVPVNQPITISTTSAFLSGNSSLKVRLRYKTYSSLN